MPNPNEKTASEEAAALPATVIDVLKSYTPPADLPAMPTPASRKGFLRRRVKSQDDEDEDEEAAELRKLEMRVEFLKKKRQLVAAIKRMEWKLESGDLESDDETSLNKNSPRPSPMRWRSSFDPRRWKKRSYSFDELSSDDDLPLIRHFHNALEIIDDGCGPIIMCANEFTDIDRQCVGYCAKDADESLYTEDQEIVVDAIPVLPVTQKEKVVEMPVDAADDARSSLFAPIMTDGVKEEATAKKANGSNEKKGNAKVIEDSNGALASSDVIRETLSRESTKAKVDEDKKEAKAVTIEDSDVYPASNLVAPITMLAKTLSQNFSSTEIAPKDLQANEKVNITDEKVNITDENIQEGKNSDVRKNDSTQGDKEGDVQEAGWMDKAASVFGSSFTQQMENDVGLDYFAKILSQPKEIADEPSMDPTKFAKVTVTPMSFSGLSITSKKKGDKSADLPPVQVVLSVLDNEESCHFVHVPGMRIVNDPSMNIAKKNYRKQHVMGIWDAVKGNDTASDDGSRLSASFVAMINLSTTEGDTEGNATRTADVKMSPTMVHLRVCIKRDGSEELLPVGVAKVLFNGRQRNIELTVPLRPEYFKSMNDLVKRLKAKPPESKWQAFKNFVLEDEEEVMTYARFKGFKNETYRLEKDAFIRINLNVAPDAKNQLSSWFSFPLLNRSGLEPTSKNDTSHQSTPILRPNDVEPPTDNGKEAPKEDVRRVWFQKDKKVESKHEDIKCTKVTTPSSLFSSKPGINDAVISKSAQAGSIVIGEKVTKDEPTEDEAAKQNIAEFSQSKSSKRAHEHFKEEAAKKKAAKVKAAKDKAEAAKENSANRTAAQEHFKKKAARKEAAKQAAKQNAGKNPWFKKSKQVVTEEEGRDIQSNMETESLNSNGDSNLGKNLVGTAGIGASWPGWIDGASNAPAVVDNSTTSEAKIDQPADSKAASDITVQPDTKSVMDKRATKNVDYSANESSSPTDDADHISLFDDAGSADLTIGDVKEDKLGESTVEQSNATDAAADTDDQAGICCHQSNVSSNNGCIPAKPKTSWFKKSKDDKTCFNAPVTATTVTGGAVAMKALRSSSGSEKNDEACQVGNEADETTKQHLVEGGIEMQNFVATDDNNPGSTKKSGWFKLTRGKPSFDKSEKTSDTSSTGSAGVEDPVVENQVTSVATIVSETVPRKGKWSFKNLRSNKHRVSSDHALGIAGTGTPAAVANHTSFEVFHHEGSKTGPTFIVEADDAQSSNLCSVEEIAETGTAPIFEEANGLGEGAKDGIFLLSDVDMVRGSDNEACDHDLSEHISEDYMKVTDQTDSPINYEECEGIEMELKHADVCKAKSNMSIRNIPGILSRSKSKRAQ